ncbi:hypothetical protein A7A08_03014 [Methyloligella halotolerans]|uniref:Uncharacterized protein n=1 Tax=Methyloligella halotolerans TaxID=1177755 RepID=A0A1E2RVB4_9HYPH|nr:hypothetical protein [Methyloligella halotolerans]ODA66161.1 hypothetical protein A7A08_03014 [Methyloligella halotolerans]
MSEGRLTYRIEVWPDDASEIHETLASASEPKVAHAAYEEALRQRPGRFVVLRKKGRVLAKSRDG